MSTACIHREFHRLSGDPSWLTGKMFWVNGSDNVAKDAPGPTIPRLAGRVSDELLIGVGKIHLSPDGNPISESARRTFPENLSKGKRNE